MRRLTPYIFFILAIFAFAMIALDSDDSWQTEEVNLLDAVLITAGVLIGAHLLRKLVQAWLVRRKDRQD